VGSRRHFQYSNARIPQGARLDLIFLVFAILASSAIVNLMKLAGTRQAPVLPMLAVNYVIASVIGWLRADPTTFTPPAFALAVGQGLMFVLGFLLLQETVRRLGSPLAASLSRMSAVLPVLGSVVFFGEDPTTGQVLGIALAFLALPLASQRLPARQELRQFWREGFGIGLVLFVFFGLNEFVLKIRNDVFPETDPDAHLAVVFTISLLTSVLVAIVRGDRPERWSVSIGVGLGVVNFLSTLFFVLALTVLPGAIAYPLNAIGIIAVTTLVGVFLWRERLRWFNGVFLALAAGAVGLIYAF
jgi:drug/metabolite transporter (DMT)-like permease